MFSLCIDYEIDIMKKHTVVFSSYVSPNYQID